MNPQPPLPRSSRAVDPSDQSLYMQNLFESLNGLTHPTTAPRSFGPPVMSHFTNNTPLATNPISNPTNSPPIPNPGSTNDAEPLLQPPVAEPATRNEPEREPFLLRPVAESTTNNRDPPTTPMPTAAGFTGASGCSAAGKMPFPPQPPMMNQPT